MSVVHERVVPPKRLYGWVDTPSALNGVMGAFDLFGVMSWLNWNRFQHDADQIALGHDYFAVADDFRSTYYRELREHGHEPPDDAVEIGFEQFTIFDPEQFRAVR